MKVDAFDPDDLDWIGEAAHEFVLAFKSFSEALDAISLMIHENFNDLDRLSEAMQKITLILNDPPEYDPRQEIGFICVNQASDTWIPRALYEARRREWGRMVRRAQRMPAKCIRRNEMYRQRERVTIR